MNPDPFTAWMADIREAATIRGQRLSTEEGIWHDRFNRYMSTEDALAEDATWQLQTGRRNMPRPSIAQTLLRWFSR